MSIITDKPWARALTVVTIAAASLALAGCSLLGNLPGGNTNAPTGEGDSTDVFTIKVGDCLNDGGATGEVSEVPVVDCAELHDSEAYASIMMTDGEFPGDTAVADQAVADCKSEFNTFAGINYDDSTLDFAYYYPTSDSWAQGDREILCLIVDPAGQIEGSLAGAAR